MKIDYIFSFVNPSDIEWQKQYTKHVNNAVFTERFRNWDCLKYSLRSISEHIPWINKVHIILSSKSQIPEWLNQCTVNVILHDDYIPKEYLPTFNSNTIESFLHNIDCVEEHFIYGNDDLYCFSYVGENDFFNANGEPLNKYRFKYKCT